MKWLLDTVLPAEGLALLCGEPFVGKSNFLCALAAAVASGSPLGGLKTRKTRVLFVSGGDAQRHNPQKIQAALKAHGLSIESVYGSGLGFYDADAHREDVPSMAPALAAEKPGLVIVDVWPPLETEELRALAIPGALVVANRLSGGSRGSAPAGVHRLKMERPRENLVSIRRPNGKPWRLRVTQTNEVLRYDSDGGRA